VFNSTFMGYMFFTRSDLATLNYYSGMLWMECSTLNSDSLRGQWRSFPGLTSALMKSSRP
jgi:hypothetical protein